MSGVRMYPTAEIIIYRPRIEKGRFKDWTWAVYLPDVSGLPTLAEGSASDYEDAWGKASRARKHIQTYGLQNEKDF